MVVTTEARPETKIESYAEFRAWTEDQSGYWFLLRGEPMPSPSPSRMHQELSKRLELPLIEAVERQNRGTVYHAPLDVVLADDLVYQPDVLVVLKRNEERLKPTHIEGAPDLVIEILSPSTAKLDLVDKRYDYARAGVAEYWIVDPDTETVERYERGEESFVLGEAARRTGRLKSQLLPEFEVDLEKLFRDL